MRIVEPTPKLDRDIEQPLLHLRFRSVIKRAVLNMALKTAFIHPLRKDRRNPFDLTHIVARDDIRVQTKVHPELALIGKALLLYFRLEHLGPGPLHGEVHIPPRMVDAPYRAHTASDRVGLHAVGSEEQIAGAGICLIGHMHHMDAGHCGLVAGHCGVVAGHCGLVAGHCGEPFRLSLWLRRLFGCLTALALSLGLFVNFILLLQIL